MLLASCVSWKTPCLNGPITAPCIPELPCSQKHQDNPRCLDEVPAQVAEGKPERQKACITNSGSATEIFILSTLFSSLQSEGVQRDDFSTPFENPLFVWQVRVKQTSYWCRLFFFWWRVLGESSHKSNKPPAFTLQMASEHRRKVPVLVCLVLQLLTAPSLAGRMSPFPWWDSGLHMPLRILN